MSTFDPKTMCAGCGALGAVPYMNSTTLYCPRCTTGQVLYDGALEHLRCLLAPAVDAWVQAWGHTDILLDASDAPDAILADLLRVASIKWPEKE